ncbi:MAG: hypothetical protein IPP53_04705 [Bacteroidetes bacterium]|nr:hypothetical protein [Bacteroidota bacterium]
MVETLINEGIISSKDIVNTAFRKRGLQIFSDLKNNSEYWKTYAEFLKKSVDFWLWFRLSLSRNSAKRSSSF